MKTERIRQEAFDALPEFSARHPDLVSGRTWKRNLNFGSRLPPYWVVCVVVESTASPGLMMIEYRTPEVTQFA